MDTEEPAESALTLAMENWIKTQSPKYVEFEAASTVIVLLPP